MNAKGLSGGIHRPLSPEGIDTFHDASLTILEKTGITFESGMSTRTIIGGAPVTQAFAEQIGADGYSTDAPGAVKLVKELVA